MPEPPLTPPSWWDGPPCPACESDTVRAKDEDGRRVWRCPNHCEITEE
jgi:hypothetical protein